MTGRANYQAFANYIQDPKVMDGVDYVAEHYPFSASTWWWFDNKMNDLVDSGATVEQVSSRVNGISPANGLEDRIYYYQRCLAVIK